ncbi:MAG TPA: VWA domain-containing protein [Armatimonadetes bacterium]|nr:VWA domain-containing protein [Armatimonadota bacterium]
MSLRFVYPWVLPLLGLLPLLAWRSRQRPPRGVLFSDTTLLRGLRPSLRVRLRPLLKGLRYTTLGLLILALARPQGLYEREKVTQRGVDIILALDVSGSMRAEDFPPNRLTVAKRVIAEFIQGLRHDQVGMVVFAGRSFTQCPLTVDYGILLDLLEEVDIGMVAMDGTAIGEALANAVYRFEMETRRRGQKGANPSRSRVIVLLTDGENNHGRVEPLFAAEMARVKGIRVHTVGLGTPEGVPVPYDTRTGRRYYRNPDGSLLITRLDEKLLRQIAARTGGVYFRATDPNALTGIYRQIRMMEQHAIEIERVAQRREGYLWFVVPALVLLGLETVLGATWLRVVSN